MKNSIYSVSILLILFGVGAYNLFPLKKESYELVWEDDFDDNKLNELIWSPVIGDGCPDLCGWGNNELQYYTDSPSNLRIEDGKLLIQAHKENISSKEFSSAKLVTKNKEDFKYGKIEIRARIPSGMGTWPAIWMLPTLNDRSRVWPQDGEIDIVEHVGYNPGMVYGTIHTAKYNGMDGTQKPDSIYIADSNLSYHTYSLEWNEESISWLVDDVSYHKLYKGDDDISGWPFDQFDHHLILNLAVGGDWGGKHGVATDIWPQTLEIDFVKYYRLNQ